MKEKNIIIEIIKILGWMICGWILWLFIFAVFTKENEEISDFLNKVSLILGLLTGIIITIIIKYNKLNHLKQIILESKSNIKILSKKNITLLEKANKVADKYMNHEKETQTKISENRSVKTSSEFQMILENYPELKANESIMKLLNQIEQNENQTANSKIIYNENVTNYNTLINNFPVAMFKNLFKLKDIEYFEEENDIISDEELGI